jgi:hypothetical protein
LDVDSLCRWSVVFGTVYFPPVGVLRLHLLFLAEDPAL